MSSFASSMRWSRRLLLWLLVVAFLLAAAASVSAAEEDAESEGEDESLSEDYSVLTYGSAVRLRHVQSAHHLHSHGINYGSGSGQQSVTAVQQDDDSGSLWQLRERQAAASVPIGTPLLCGDTVRLQHVSTRRYLHSHLHASPLTNRQEVSGYGEGSHSDSGDDWRIDCSGGLSVGTELPLTSASPAPSFSLLHVDTGKRLYSRRMDEFTQHNCRGCPIIGQLEISAAAVQQHDPAAQFSVRPSGIFFPRKQQQAAATQRL